MRRFEKKVQLYDPVRDAYYEVDVETAKKFLASMKDAEAQIAALEEVE